MKSPLLGAAPDLCLGWVSRFGELLDIDRRQGKVAVAAGRRADEVQTHWTRQGGACGATVEGPLSSC